MWLTSRCRSSPPVPRLKPVDWRTLVRVFEADGFATEWVAGSHIVLSKPGVARPIVIPRYDAVRLDIIRNNMRTAGMTRVRYFELLARSR